MDLDNDFGEELRLARDRAGMTREQLSKLTNYSVSQTAQVERGEKSPSLEFSKRMDEALDTGGLFERMRARNLRHRVVPDWFRAYRDNEQQASKIVIFELALVPGLLQTPEYALALMKNDDMVAARIERQQVLERAEVHAILAEQALHNPVASPTVMAGQLEHLLTVNATVQILPTGAATNIWVDGPFTMATVDGSEVVYTPTPLRGYVLDSTSDISEARRRLEIIRAEALPRSLSREPIQKVAEQWRSETT